MPVRLPGRPVRRGGARLDCPEMGRLGIDMTRFWRQCARILAFTVVLGLGAATAQERDLSIRAFYGK